MVARRANPTYLPDVTFPEAVRADAVARRRARRRAPTSSWRCRRTDCARVVARPRRTFRPDAMLVSATKGIETDTLQRMSEVIDGGDRTAGIRSSCCRGRALPRRSRGGCRRRSSRRPSDQQRRAAVQDEFRGPSFRLYGSDDVVGVEIGAALKNIIAIAAGVVESLGLGHNAMSALITRGLAEISRLACAMGGRRETLAGLSGLGDLVLTCTGSLSRNRHVGIELGRGRSLDEILAGMRMVAEGVQHDVRRAGARRAPRRRAADRRADGRGARRPQDTAGGRRRSHAAAAARRARRRVMAVILRHASAPVSRRPRSRSAIA